MNNIEFVNKLKEIEEKYITHYANGTFGQCATMSVIQNKSTQYPKQYTNNVIDTLLLLPDDARLFDCCGLIKGVLWGFPNTIYTSNGVPDINDQGFWDKAVEKSTDFSKIEIGELLWLKGHVGVYIGDGKAIECTNKWTQNVLISTVGNIAKGKNQRTWTGHGKLPYITYGVDANKPIKADTPRAKVVTKSDPLYCRTRPNGTIISSFLRGTLVEVLFKEGDWWRVKGVDYRGNVVIGYSSSKYLEEV